MRRTIPCIEIGRRRDVAWIDGDDLRRRVVIDLRRQRFGAVHLGDLVDGAEGVLRAGGGNVAELRFGSDVVAVGAAFALDV